MDKADKVAPRPISEAQRMTGLSTNPSSFSGGDNPRDMPYRQAVTLRWISDGDREKRRSKTEAPLWLLHDTLERLSGNSNCGIERLASWGGVEVAEADELLTNLAECRKGLLDIKSDVNDVQFFLDTRDALDVRTFRWEGSVDRGNSNKLEYWSSEVMERYGSLAAKTTSRRAVVTQVYEWVWLLRSGAPLTDMEKSAAQAAMDSWQQRCLEFHQRLTRLLERASRLKK